MTSRPDDRSATQTVQSAEDRDNAMMADIMDRLLRPDSNCVDVGAHSGNILEQMVLRAPDGTHFGFEPLPHLADIAQRRFPKARITQCAVGDQEGTITFHHVVSNPGYSGMRPRTYPGEETVEQITVPVHRLDALLPADFVARLVKVDVEGAELAVFRSGRVFFSRSRPHIIFEFGLGAADHYGVRPEDLFDLLVTDFGLQISGMAEWLAGAPPFTREAFCHTYNTGGIMWNFLAHPSR